MPYRSPARFLAPIVLLTAIFAVYTIVDKNLGNSEDDTPAATAAPAASKGSRKTSKKPRTYVVRAGDTLSGISQKTGVSLETLQRLNEQIDANSLRAGQKLKLRAAT